MLPSSRKSAGAGQSGFSLVEVVLAVGVVAFAFVAIMGLIPAGIHQFRLAIDNSVCTQIAQRVILDCEQTDFNTLVDYTNTQAQGQYYFRAPSLQATSSNPGLCIRYFDESGNEIIPANPGQPTTAELAAAIYWVNTRIGASTALPKPLGSSVPNSFDIATVLVQVAFNPGQLPFQLVPLTPTGTGTSSNPSYTINTSKMPTLVVRNYNAIIGRNF